MATVRMAGAALLTTVTEVASTFTCVVKSVGNAAEMLNDYTDDAKWRQQRALKINRVGYEDVLKAQKSVEIMQSRAVLDDYLAQHPDQKELADKIWSELETALA